MIISSSPVRVSLSSSDHSPFSERFGGVALNFTINKRVYIFIRKRNKFEDFNFRVSYSTTELCDSVDAIQLGTVREAIKMASLENERLEIIYSSDVPSCTGLSTSSAATAALLKGLFYYKNIGLSNELLTKYAYTLERDRLKEAGGFQDQPAVVFGGINYITGDCRDIQRKAVILSPDKIKQFESHMLLISLGDRKESFVVLEDQLAKLRCGTTLEEAFAIKKLVEEMHAIMLDKSFHPLHLVGPIQEAWGLKKRLSDTIVTPLVTEIEHKLQTISSEIAIRLVGGGGRGAILVLADPKYRQDILNAVHPLKTIDIEIDWDGVKTRRIF